MTKITTVGLDLAEIEREMGCLQGQREVLPAKRQSFRMQKLKK
jgi:hypothetical protein